MTLSVCAVGRGGPIVGLVDEDGTDRWGPEVEVLEILLKIRRTIAAPQLDDADGLSVAVGIAGKIIERGHLQRRVGGG
jgi:hypothetical protein